MHLFLKQNRNNLQFLTKERTIFRHVYRSIKIGLSTSTYCEFILLILSDFFSKKKKSQGLTLCHQEP